ncbi:MAG: PHP domain-containing protein [Megasphaera sp.]|jgi:putative hydrolase|nr:PHP domain-containing protein [Megasphaera sp.]MCH4187882.1 PHP domain-containing protein [Megasphaera sp.]
MNIIADLHTHTLLCRHGFSTVTEVMEEAGRQGLLAVGLTEHGPGYPGSVGWAYFNTYRDIPRKVGDLEVLCGAEANFMKLDGTLDFTDDQLAKLDIVIASCHKECSPSGTEQEVTGMMTAAMKQGYVDIIGHPDNPIYPVNAEVLAAAAAKYQVALEINNSSPAARPGSEPMCRQIIAAAKRHGTLLAVNSDAHYHKVVGSFAYALRLLTEMEVPEEQVINSSLDRLHHFLSGRHSCNMIK